MEFEGRSRISMQLNMMPLIDVVLLLLIFFMLTSTYLVAEAIDLELPFSDRARPVEEQDIVVTMALDGSLKVSGEVVPSAKTAGGPRPTNWLAWNVTSVLSSTRS